MAGEPADVAVIEIGASPLEPYNGAVAIEALREATRCVVLVASVAYSARGLMDASDFRLDLICGPAANTAAGIAFSEALCGAATLNLRDPADHEELDWLLEEKLRGEALPSDG